MRELSQRKARFEHRARNLNWARLVCSWSLSSSQSGALAELSARRWTLRVVLWSISSVFERGKGLPAGWLGLLGFAEAGFATPTMAGQALSYLASLLVAAAALVSSFRAPPQTQSKASYSAASSKFPCAGANHQTVNFLHFLGTILSKLCWSLCSSAQVPDS